MAVYLATAIIYIGQRLAIEKRIITDGGDTVANGDGGQGLAIRKRIPTDGSDGIAINGIRDDKFASDIDITTDDGYLAVVGFVG